MAQSNKFRAYIAGVLTGLSLGITQYVITAPKRVDVFDVDNDKIDDIIVSRLAGPQIYFGFREKDCHIVNYSKFEDLPKKKQRELLKEKKERSIDLGNGKIEERTVTELDCIVERAEHVVRCREMNEASERRNEEYRR